MLTEEFLTGLLGNEEVSVEDKIKQILTEHEADTNATTVGLVKKRDELLGNEKKLKEQISAYEESKGVSEAKIKELNELLEKSNAGDKKAEDYYNTKLAELDSKHKEELGKITNESEHYHSLYIQMLEDKAFEEGIKDLQFVPGLKDGFLARVRMLNQFEPSEVEGKIKFLNKDNHTIEDVIKAFAMSPEGKAYIANPSTGGGARGSTGAVANDKTMTREQFSKMQSENPAAAAEFFSKGGKIVN